MGASRIPVTGDGDWRDAPAIKARLAGGYCLRAPAQGSCPYANICEHCPNFRTDAASVSVLSAQRVDAEALAADAESRGWIDEADRHRRLIARLDALLAKVRIGGMTSPETLARIEQSVRRTVPRRQPVTFTTVAERAGISRTTLYRDQSLRTVVEEHRIRSHDPRTLSGLASEVGHLRTAVEALAERVRRHEEQLRRLGNSSPRRKAN